MATPLDELQTALINADKAGDTEAAHSLAQAIRSHSQPHFSVADIQRIASQYKIDPLSLGSPGQRFLAGMGKEFVNVGRGAEQIAGGIGAALNIPGAASLKQAATAKTEEEAEMQRRLTSTRAGALGSVAGDVAIIAPTAMIPGVNTLAGSIATGGALGALQPVSEGESRLKNTALGAAGGALGYGAGAVISKGARAGADYLAARRAEETLLGSREAAVTQARSLKYRLTPSQAGGAPIGELSEAISGVPNLEQGMSKVNQKLTNDLSKQEFGIPKSTRLDEDTLESLKRPANKIYNEVSKIGVVPTDAQYAKDVNAVGFRSKDMAEDFPEAASQEINKLKQAYLKPQFRGSSAISAIRTLRNSSAKNLRMYDPEKNELGYAQKQIADALENQVERYASSRPPGFDKPDLVQRFRQARVQLAKIHSLESALDPETGDISAQNLARQLKNGVPLSGNLKAIAQVASHFPRSMQDASKMVRQGPYSRLDFMLGMGGAITHSPKLLAAVAARPLVKKFLLSDLYQASLKGGKEGELTRKALDTIARGAENNPLLLRALPGAGAELMTPSP